MIPVGAIVAAVLIASRASGGGGGGYAGRSALFFVQWLVAAFCIPGGIALILDKNPLGALLLAFGVVLAFPWAIARAFALPRGRVKTTWMLACMSDWTWGADRMAGAYVAAILAYRKRPTPEGAAFLQRREKLLKRPGGALPTALGLLAEHHGDLDAARALFRTSARFDARVTPRAAKCIAQDWLAADLARRGAWDELARFDARWSRIAALYVRCARRIARTDDAPGDLSLRLFWLLAPARRKTRPLFQRALLVEKKAGGAVDEVDVTDPPPFDDDPDDVAAVRLHVATLRRPPAERTGARIERAARAWQVACDAENAVDGDLAVRALVELVKDVDLRTADVDDGDLHLLERAKDELRTERLAALELQSDALRRRAEELQDLPPADELREIAALLKAYDETARTGHEAHRLAWEAVHFNACLMGVRLWNVRKETRLGNVLFKWLLDEAKANHDVDNTTLHEKNVKCGP